MLSVLIFIISLRQDLFRFFVDRFEFLFISTILFNNFLIFILDAEESLD